MEWTVGISLQCHNCGCVIKYKITGMIIHHIWVCQLFQRVGENLQSKLFWSVIQLGVPESVWWPLPPALQLSQSVLPGQNMLRPHSLSCFHGSDVQVGVPDGALFWMRKWWRGLIKKKSLATVCHIILDQSPRDAFYPHSAPSVSSDWFLVGISEIHI